jgi:hypothetical protein
MTGGIHVFGIRHHGPGSARSLRRALEELRPDAILVEGPPDGEEVLPLLAQAAMRPPVALLVYRPDAPRQAVFYPFAHFSPEWQALQYGLAHAVPTRFMDLPQCHQLALQLVDDPDSEEQVTSPAEAPDADASASGHPTAGPTEPPADALQTPESATEDPRRDPLGWLAEAAGYSDGERWWDHLVEQRRDGADLFAGIREAMAALREAVGTPEDPAEARREALREAWMRRTIRAAQREGFARIAVVCGAWHVPALVELPPAREDAAMLQGIPRTKVAATWVPWTHGRLAAASGYGAGIAAPGWYQHLWSEPEPVTVRWLTRVARLLRAEDLDASAAHVIEAVRLAEALAALRDRPLPGLPELNEATQAVLCAGDPLPMRLIHERLIVGETLGAVPRETPSVPLQADLEREQRRLRLAPEALARALDLDLRKPTDRERSHLLHRLLLLEIPWGSEQAAHGKSGTFHELWQLQWQPELAVAVIEASAWGNTVAAAATGRALEMASCAPALPALTSLLDRALLANLVEAIGPLMDRLQVLAAAAGDAGELMDALPPLARVVRYGSVRQTDTTMVRRVVDGLVARIGVGLPVACASLNDEAAGAMFARLLATNDAVSLLEDPAHLEGWRAALGRLADQRGVHGLVSGRCCRLLLDQGVFDAHEVARRLNFALSAASEPAPGAAWVEGLLRGSGLLLLHHEALWQVLDEWVTGLGAEAFTELLPLLRRTFATFSAPERRQMGERVRGRTPGPSPAAGGADFDEERADAVLPLVAQLLGVAA